MKVRLSHSGLAITALAAFVASPVLAQSGKTGERVMIPTLQSAEKDLGVQAAEAIRSQLTKQTNIRDLVVVPKADINNYQLRMDTDMPSFRGRLSDGELGDLLAYLISLKG